MKPTIIQGGRFADHRGTVSYVNEFSFKDIERFYIITNADSNPIRAWQGHKLDAKNFYCVRGSFAIHFVPVDDWDHPATDAIVEQVVVTALDSKIVHIPAGYANAIVALEPDSQLLSFSTLPLDQVQEDDVRYATDYWAIDG